MSKVADHIMRDLTRKCADDVSARVDQTARLLTDPRDCMMIAIAGAAVSLGSAAGFSGMVHTDLRPEQLADLMWSIMRPIVLKTLGGDEADWQKLLEMSRG